MTTAIQLPQILIRNSFNILGLSSSSALKEIRKRSQQLLQLAKIEEVQEFDIDIGQVKEFRNESEIRLALERISGIQDRLKEIFFWFEDHRLESRKALEFISKGIYQKAVAIFKASSSDWLDKKNLALVLMFQAFVSSSMEYFCQSLDIWKLIVESDEFWKFYEKHYLLHDELGCSHSLFEDFRSSIFETLSTKAVSLYHQTKNPEAIGAFYTAFCKIGKTVDSEILQPLLMKINKEMEELEIIANTKQAIVVVALTMLQGLSLPLSDDDEWVVESRKLLDLDNFKSISKETTFHTLIQKIVRKINNSFILLEKFELNEYSPLIILKNNTAEKLRSIAIDIYNKDIDDVVLARLLLNQSAKLASLEILIDKIEADKKQLKKNEAWNAVVERFNPIRELIESQELEEANSAYLELDKDLEKEAAKSSAYNRIQLLINYCTALMDKGRELFNTKKFGIETLAISGLLNGKTRRDGIFAHEQSLEILKDRVELIKFTNPTSDRAELLEAIDFVLNDLRNCELSFLLDRCQSHLKTIEETSNQQSDENAQTFILLLGAAVCYTVLYQRLHGVNKRELWKWIGWGAAIALFVIVINQKDTSSTYSEYLNYDEKKVIEYLMNDHPDVIRDARNNGYTDKEIAQYILKVAEDEK